MSPFLRHFPLAADLKDMAQGKTNLAKKKASGGRSSAPKDLKKGRVVIAPKAAAAVKHNMMRKVRLSLV